MAKQVRSLGAGIAWRYSYKQWYLYEYEYSYKYGCPRTSKKVVRVRSEVFRKQASTFLNFFSSIRIRDVSGISSDLEKSKRHQGSFLYNTSTVFAFLLEVRGHPYLLKVTPGTRW